MTELGRTVAEGITQGSASLVDGRTSNKEMTPRHILTSTTIVLAQLVQVCTLQLSPSYYYDELNTNRNCSDDPLRLGYQCWFRNR